MHSYEIKNECISISGTDYQIQSLLNTNQYSDPEGLAEKKGIYSSVWSLFGVIWPSSIILAELVDQFPLKNKKVLEIGCGLGLASLVASRNGLTITASDYHPLAKKFLDKNIEKNNLLPINFIDFDWNHSLSEEGMFDVIIASDILYDISHNEILTKFILRHAEACSTVLIVDPGRRHYKKFINMMENIGYTCTTTIIKPRLVLGNKYKGRILQFDKSG